MSATLANGTTSPPGSGIGTSLDTGGGDPEHTGAWEQLAEARDWRQEYADQLFATFQESHTGHDSTLRLTGRHDECATVVACRGDSGVRAVAVDAGDG